MKATIEADGEDLMSTKPSWDSFFVSVRQSHLDPSATAVMAQQLGITFR